MLHCARFCAFVEDRRNEPYLSRCVERRVGCLAGRVGACRIACAALDGCRPDGLVFCGPGGGNKVSRGTRTKLSIGNYRRVYDRAAARAGLTSLDLHGPHDLRHTFATWLEDGGIPARVIDELIGHEASGRGQQRGSAMGAHYRHTTPEMAARAVDAIQQRLTVVLGVAELAVESHPNRSTLRAF